MQSNRLTVVLNTEMQTSFLRGINQVYKNSHLINDFVVRPTFLLSPTETIWVTFQNAETNPTITLAPTLLTERKTTVTNSTEQVVDTGKSQILQTPDTGYEYYTVLPDAVLANDGQWWFSLAIREIPDSANADEFETVSTSDIASFTVFDSLAGAGPNGSTPTDLDIAALYKTALQAVTDAAKSAEDAKKTAENVSVLTNGTYPEMTVGKALNDGNGNNIANQFSALDERVQNTQEQLANETQRATAAEQSLQNDITGINEKIPSAASQTNQLADKAFVNSSINNMAAFYIEYNAQGDAFPTRESLLNATTFYSGGKPRVPTQNDYATVLADESRPQGANGEYPTTRYSYQTETQNGTYPNGQWGFQYVVNNTSLTQAQVNAINSGITSELVSKTVTTDTNQYLSGTKTFARVTISVTGDLQFARQGGVTSISENPSQVGSGTLMLPAQHGTLITVSEVETKIAAAVTTALNTPV